MKRVFFIAFVLIVKSYAQFATPTINGTIGTGEYGDHTDGQN